STPSRRRTRSRPRPPAPPRPRPPPSPPAPRPPPRRSPRRPSSHSPHVKRARVIRAYDHRDTLTLLGDDGVTRRLAGDSASLARAVLEFVATPHTREELYA